MAIEIHGYPNRPIKDNVENVSARDGQTSATPSSASTPAAADQVSLTASAALLKELEKGIAGLPIVDTGRVEAVQRALATGTFRVDPARTADKLMQLELIINGED